jgi:hypothetical protein
MSDPRPDFGEAGRDVLLNDDTFDTPTGDEDSAQHREFTVAEEELRAKNDTGPRWVATSRAREDARRYPDFFVVGAQKAGTTWLYRNLDFHPDVWLPPIKELNYFNEIYFPSSDGWEAAGRSSQAQDALAFYDSIERLTLRQVSKRRALEVILRNEQTDDWYGEIFSCAGDDMMCGDISPDYSLLPRVAISRIAAQNPCAKFVVILRDPIERAWSNARMTFARGEAEEAEMLLHDPAHWRIMRGRSNYPPLLQRWASIVAPHNLIVLSFDNLETDPQRFLSHLCQRLGLHYDPRFFPYANSIVREGGVDLMSEETLAGLRSDMRPIYEELNAMYPDIARPWLLKHYSA